MEKIVTICINIICMLFLIVLVNDYSDALLVIISLILICFLFFVLIRFRKKYIPKSILILYPICVFIQCLVINLLGKIGIWKIGNGIIGLGSALATFFYFCMHFIFFILLLLINCFKWGLIKITNRKG